MLKIIAEITVNKIVSYDEEIISENNNLTDNEIKSLITEYIIKDFGTNLKNISFVFCKQMI